MESFVNRRHPKKNEDRFRRVRSHSREWAYTQYVEEKGISTLYSTRLRQKTHFDQAHPLA